MKKYKYYILIFLIIVAALVAYGVYAFLNTENMTIKSPTGNTVFNHCRFIDDDCWSKKYENVKNCPMGSDGLADKNCWLPEIINCNLGSKLGSFYSEDSQGKPITLYERIVGRVEVPDEGLVCKTVIYSTSHRDWQGSSKYYGRDGIPLPRVVY